LNRSLCAVTVACTARAAVQHELMSHSKRSFTMRASSIQWCVRPIAMLVLACGFAEAASGQQYIAEVLNRLVALPGIPATYFHFVGSPGGAVGHGYGTATGSIPHAMYMPPGASVAVDLNPAGVFESYAERCSGSQQVGYGWVSAVNQYHALLWNGSASSVVDLNPPGYSNSRAEVTDGAQQGGFASAGSPGIHAVIWSGSAGTAVFLHPAAYHSSRVVGLGGGQQVGYSTLPSSTTLFRAMVWNGTVESATDLHVSGFTDTFAFGAGGGRQVGYGKPTSGPASTRALMWSGTAESVVDLHPTGFTTSAAYATNGEVQVGGGGPGAAAWSGSAESYVNLHAFLPAGFSGSLATSIDDDGVIYGRAYGTSASGTGYHVVRWTPVGGCIGDYNGAGDEGDILDFLDFFDDFGTCEGQPGPCGSAGDADVNGDTIVDILDFLDFLDSFGTGC
jgi:hypothetical protein